jgi:hypothetical protein
MIVTSTDNGLTWATTLSVPGSGVTSAIVESFVWTGAHWVAVGGWVPTGSSFGYAQVWTSPDGITWTIGTLNPTGSVTPGSLFIDVDYDPSTGTLIAALQQGYGAGLPTLNIAISTDGGTTWTPYYIGGSGNTYIEAVASDKAGAWVAIVGFFTGAGPGYTTLHSLDAGATWTPDTDPSLSPAKSALSVAFGSGLWEVTWVPADPVVMKASGGGGAAPGTWANDTTPWDNNGFAYDVAIAGGVFVIVGIGLATAGGGWLMGGQAAGSVFPAGWFSGASD